MNVFEIWRGAFSDKDREEARRLLRGARVYPLTVVAAKLAAEVEQALRDNPIGEHDTLIAGICLAIGRPILTRNVRHFQRVPGLDVVHAH